MHKLTKLEKQEVSVGSCSGGLASGILGTVDSINTGLINANEDLVTCLFGCSR
jgi:hypothetical protein